MILCLVFFRPDDQDALAGKGQISLAVAALNLASAASQDLLCKEEEIW
jgi:hypothetical protein